MGLMEEEEKTRRRVNCRAERMDHSLNPLRRWTHRIHFVIPEMLKSSGIENLIWLSTLEWKTRTKSKITMLMIQKILTTVTKMEFLSLLLRSRTILLKY